ncbi:MAG TPA: 16S rRNA (cytosine(967)-C(5))-methyltransferase RsmB [Burkholderiaceae bacterium]|nr:16S rRNA (cytosine(967)-C(5))-methyltransferase RsmB [Burkholderiaceae bacterium]
MLETGGPAPPLADVLLAAAGVWRAFAAGQSLDRAMSQGRSNEVPRLRAAMQDVSYTAVRHRALIEGAVARLASRSPAPDVTALLAVALGQLLDDRHAAHTVVDQAVAAARRQAPTAAAAGFVNAILRNFLRRRDSLLETLQQDEQVVYNAPSWWIEAIRAAHPANWRELLTRGQQPPPLVLRVNQRRTNVESQLQRLAEAGMEATRVGRDAVWLHQPRPVAMIPGFVAGEVSVQDAGAQLAADWLDVRDGMRVLDACAAPGGKTAHLAELADLDLTAVERDADRAQRIDDNLARVARSAHVVIADASKPSEWWKGRRFDRILLDAPCTASGIVRRHPDIPWLRRRSDVAHLATEQRALLDALWPLLEVGGRLLYVVCSVFPQEGSEQISQFVCRQPDAGIRNLPGGKPSALLLPTAATAGRWRDGFEWPTLHDGFFYASLEKSG